ncbi:MAG TPA: GNAT family N-acetyltransferase [Methylomirabilota bacterium]|nr:GNAT family N-acetyltransferase [Methylomirabilota bacterium]
MSLIRPAVDADGPLVARLIADVFAEYEGCPFVAAEFPELAAPATHYRDRGGGLWVVEADGGVIGSLGLSCVDGGPIFELNKVYLAASHRGSGLAQRLYALAETEARAKGAKALRLWTDTRFAAGHRFYEKHGFRRLPVVRYLADATHAWEFAYLKEFPA